MTNTLEKEYLQAVQEVLESIEDVYNQHPEFEKAEIVGGCAGQYLAGLHQNRKLL